MKIAGRRYDTGATVTLTLTDGIIAAEEEGVAGPCLGGSEDWLAPAFIDVQLNGYGGSDFNQGCWQSDGEVRHDPAAVLESAAAAGTAYVCPTIYTDSLKAMCRSLSMAASAIDAGLQGVAGFHVEGPWLSAEDGPRGAHPLQHIRPPSWEEYLRLEEASGGRIRIVTLAPELPGALKLIERLAERGLAAAIGHTGASPETIRDAVSAGARLSTHLGNGAHAILPRHPNYLWEQLASDRLFASVIGDGHHLPAAVLKVFARAKTPQRLLLVSDAVALGGLPAGSYTGGRFEVQASGKIVLAGTPYLAGAGHLLNVCVANASRCGALSLPEAIDCASLIPARLLGIDGRKGSLAPGHDADIILFRPTEDGPLTIRATLRAGKLIRDNGSPAI